MNNWKDKKDAYKRVLGLFRASYGKNLIKISNETLEHFIVKCQVSKWFWDNGWDTYSEASFKSGGRADIVVVNPKTGDSYAVEILCTETEKRFNEKDYPLPIIKVYVKDWNYVSFCI